MNNYTIEIHNLTQELIEKVYAQREEILEAFIAKYNIQPEEAVQILEYKDNKVIWYITTKEVKKHGK